jgi:hypothetical protein
MPRSRVTASPQTIWPIEGLAGVLLGRVQEVRRANLSMIGAVGGQQYQHSGTVSRSYRAVLQK